MPRPRKVASTFADGTLTHAYTGLLVGPEATYEILSWPDPTVEIFHKRRSREQTVHAPLQHVLMEAARLLDERQHAHSGETHAPPAEPDSPAATPPPAQPAVQAVLQEALDIEGAVGVALVHIASGKTLGEACRSRGFDVAGAAGRAADVMRTQREGMDALTPKDTIEDLMVTLGKQYHLSRVLDASPDSFLYLVLARDRAKLGGARHQLAKLARRIQP